MAIWSPLSVLKRSTTSTYFFADWWCGGCAGCSFPPLQKLVKSFLCSVLWGICQEKARWYMRNHKLLPTYQPSIWMSWSQKLINVNLQLICIKKHFFHERSKSLKVKESQLAKSKVSKPLRCEAFVLGPEAELQVMKWGTPKRRP